MSMTVDYIFCKENICCELIEQKIQICEIYLTMKSFGVTAWTSSYFHAPWPKPKSPTEDINSQWETIFYYGGQG